MAIVARITVAAAGQAEHDRLEQAVGSQLERLGGPPDGLMVHLSHPQDGGIVITEAWRTEETFRRYVDDVLVPAFAEAGLTLGEAEVAPAWGMARP